MISGGVLSSWPSQNGHRGVPADGISTLGVMGRLARSVAMMAQRPTMGSLRNSGIGRLRRWCSAKVLEDVSMRNRLDVPHDLLEIRRRACQVDGPFPGRAVAALPAFEQLDEEVDRLIHLH